MDLFACPAPTSLASVPATSCPIKFDQIQKMGIRRISGATALTTTNILLLATLTPLLSASDNTKLLITPFLNNLVIPPSEPIKQGGNDNTTLNGVPMLEGLGFVTCTAQLRNVSSEAAKALRALAAESAIQPGVTNIEGIFFNRPGKVIIDKTGTTSLAGFKLYNFIVSDAGTEGLNKDNVFNISWDMEGGWSENFQMYKPTDYNPLTLSN